MISTEKKLFWSKRNIRILFSAGLILLLVDSFSAFLDGSDKLMLRNIGLSLMIFASILNPPNLDEKINFSTLGFDSFIDREHPSLLLYSTIMLSGCILLIASFIIN